MRKFLMGLSVFVTSGGFCMNTEVSILDLSDKDPSVNLLELRIYPDPIFGRKCDNVSKEDPKISDILDEMIQKLDSTNGVVLAAPQVGILKRLLVIKIDNGIFLEFINPEITWKSADKIDSTEESISIPGVQGIVRRRRSVIIKYQNREFETKVEGTQNEFISRYLQHGINLLNGTLFIDEINQSAREALLTEYEKKLYGNGNPETK